MCVWKKEKFSEAEIRKVQNLSVLGDSQVGANGKGPRLRRVCGCRRSKVSCRVWSWGKVGRAGGCKELPRGGLGPLKKLAASPRPHSIVSAF